MEIEYRGANSIVIKDKKILIVVDPTTNVSVKEAKNPEAVILLTQKGLAIDEQGSGGFVIDMPGEYERNDVSVVGMPVKSHISPVEQAKTATMYAIAVGNTRIAVIGHASAPLTDDDLENLGLVDIVVIPVGGGGYTLDARDAATIVRQISPKAVIPTHYADTRVKYEVPQEPVENFIKELASAHEKLPALKVKNLPEVLTIYELSRTA
jgi:L-ascorbate metabolism protein UlaG (beta-lactamase superfamily)